MSHSVSKHLRLDVAKYDGVIRRFIPGYEEMIGRAAAEVASIRPGLVLDLGAGTGALSGAMLALHDVASVELLDVDAEMLERARSRLQPYAWRAQYRVRSFADPLPSCDAVAASLALHHIPTLEAKSDLYRRIEQVLWGGGVFVNADVMMPDDGAARNAQFRVWADHLVASGIEEQQAWRHFEEWAEEDTYFSLDAELEALRSAGFSACECVWECGPIKVVVGRR